MVLGLVVFLVRAVVMFWLCCLVGCVVDFVVYLLLVFSFIILGTAVVVRLYLVTCCLALVLRLAFIVSLLFDSVCSGLVTCVGCGAWVASVGTLYWCFMFVWYFNVWWVWRLRVRFALLFCWLLLW